MCAWRDVSAWVLWKGFEFRRCASARVRGLALFVSEARKVCSVKVYYTYAHLAIELRLCDVSAWIDEKVLGFQFYVNETFFLINKYII